MIVVANLNFANSSNQQLDSYFSVEKTFGVLKLLCFSSAGYISGKMCSCENAGGKWGWGWGVGLGAGFEKKCIVAGIQYLKVLVKY